VVAPERSTDPEAAREAALRLLERTRRTRSDLSRRLIERGFAPGTVDDVIERLKAVGLVDDTEFARAFLSGRWGRRAAGWRRLENDLRGRGISSDDIKTARARLEESVGPVDEVAGARRVIRQTARRYAGLDPRTRRQRLWSLLSRRGFDSDTIEQALREEVANDAQS
jgi:regulatory protein